MTRRPAALLLPLLLYASPGVAQGISGTVFEDANYGGGAGRSLASSSGVGRPAAVVELYDGGGAFLTFTATDASGNYAFPGLSAGGYTVRVVSSTVTSSRTGYVAGLLPVQTYRTDASTGSPAAVTDHVGGQNPAVDDAGVGGAGTVMDATTGVFTAGLTGTAQSIAPVALGATEIAGLDFGFNFNTIVNPNDSGQGSLRQFILNSNALDNTGLAIVGQAAGRDVTVFMISDGLPHAGLRAGLANLLSGAGVAVIPIATALPALTAAGTSVDGATQTANVGNTNAIVLGTGGTVGVDGLALGTVAGPEVEIASGGTLACGLLIQAADAVVRRLAILGFGTAAGQGGVCVDAFPGALIESNVLGSGATSFADPGSAQRNQAGVYSGGGTGGIVRNNLVGFGRVSGVYLGAGTSGFTITGNEIRDSGMDTVDGDGITINASPTSTSTGNLIAGSSSQGIVVTVAGATGNVFENNTVTGNGVGIPSGLTQSAGIVLRAGATATVLDRNVIQANYGAGVQVNDGSTGTRMTRNSFALNGTIAARNGGAPTGQIGIDLNSPTDDINLGTAPFYTLNEAADADAGGNDLLNFPILLSASVSGGSLTLRGFASPGSVIEVFVPSPDPTGFGEGTSYGLTLTEGGTGSGGDDAYADTDPGSGTYGPAPLNGIAQGTDTTNRFAFTFPAPGGVGVGTLLTATATLGGRTSEFGGSVAVTSATAVKLMSFEAAASDGSVVLHWSTASELSNLGFHVWRGPSAEGPWTRLTQSLIPGLGSSPIGESYSWLDGGLTNGETYSYRLEDVDTASVSTFHGPVSATPLAAAEPPPSDGGGGSGGGTGPATTTCPSWVLTALGTSSSGEVTCTRHGDPEAVSFDVVSRDAQGAVLELRTGGFWAARCVSGAGEATGRVRVFVPDFDTLAEPTAPALPVRRALVEAVVGKKVRLVSAEALDLRGFGDLRPAAVGVAEMAVARDGTVRPARRAVAAPLPSRGYVPQSVARLAGTVFQGEAKSAVVELTPVRFDGSRGRLVLAGRLRVHLAFAGLEPEETGTGTRGRRLPGRVAPVRDVLAQLHTSRRGLHAVSFEDLFPEQRRGLSVSQLRLQRRGQAVGLRVEPTTGVFGPGSTLFFFADEVPSSAEYSGEVAWELVRSTVGLGVGLGPGPGMGVVPGRPEGGPGQSSSTGFATFETNRIYQPGLLEAPDVWLWEGMASAVKRTVTLSLSGVETASSRAAQLTAHLQGGSESGHSEEHHVEVTLNDVVVGEGRFAGKKPYGLSVSVPASQLVEGANSLSVLNAGDTGVSSLVFLDKVSVSYPQAPLARGGVFEGVWGEGGTVEVGGLTSSPAVLDVTLAGAAKWVVDHETLAGSVRFRAEAGHRYVVVSGEGLLAPRVERPRPSTLRARANQADYLLIAPRAFLPAAEPLLARRESQGLRAKGVAFEEIAEVFGRGQPSAEAIRDFVAYAYHSWSRASPRYVVLLGDASYDPRRFQGTSWASPLPALWAKTSYLWTASDPVLAAVNGEDAIPDLAIGRLPATSVEQAEELVSKLLAWEDSGQELGGKAVLVADDPDAAGDFEADVADIHRSFLGGRTTEILKLRELGASTRGAIGAAFDEGASLMSYVGHGGAAVWASENVWNSWDAPSLRAQSRQPLFVTMNCLNGYFVASNFESLSEAMLKAPGRGAIAAFSPSGLSLDGPAHQYHRAVVAEVAGGHHERLGDAILAAQKAYARSGLMPELLTVYHLLGDPAMRTR